MKKAKKPEPIPVFSHFKSPYGRFKDDTDCIYEKYKKDPKRIKIINGEKYYKIIESFCLNLKGSKPRLIVMVTSDITPLRIDDTVIDNYGHKFTFTGTPFIRFGNGIPEWYIGKGIILSLSGGFKIGEYIRKI